MHYNAEQVMRGMMEYADHEVISKMPTIGKWVIGAGIGIASDKMEDIINSMQHNSIIKMIGVVDDAGCFDVEMLASYLCESADKYGKAVIDLPIMGSVSFTKSDIETLKNYILRA